MVHRLGNLSSHIELRSLLSIKSTRSAHSVHVSVSRECRVQRLCPISTFRVVYQSCNARAIAHPI